MATKIKVQSRFRRAFLEPSKSSASSKTSPSLQPGAQHSKRNQQIDYNARRIYARQLFELRNWLDRMLFFYPELKTVHNLEELNHYFLAHPDPELEKQRGRLVDALIIRHLGQPDIDEVPERAQIQEASEKENKKAPAEKPAERGTEVRKVSPEKPAEKPLQVTKEANSEVVAVPTIPATAPNVTQQNPTKPIQARPNRVGAKGSKVELQRSQTVAPGNPIAINPSRREVIPKTPESKYPRGRAAIGAKGSKVELQRTPRRVEPPFKRHKVSELSFVRKDIVTGIKGVVKDREERDAAFNKKRAEIHELYAPLVKDKSQLSKLADTWKDIAARAPELQYANSKEQFDEIRERLNADGKNIPYNAWTLYRASIDLQRVIDSEAERDAELAEVDKEQSNIPLDKIKKAERPTAPPLLNNDPVFRQEYLAKVEKQIDAAQKKAGRKFTLQETQTLRKELMATALQEYAIANPNRAKYYAPFHSGLRQVLIQQAKEAEVAVEQKKVRIAALNAARAPSPAAANTTRLKDFIQEAKVYPQQIQPQADMGRVYSQPYASNYPKAPSEEQPSGGSGNGSGAATPASKQASKKPQPQQQSRRAVPPPLASALRIASLIQRFWFAIPFIVTLLIILLFTIIIVVLVGGGTSPDTAVAGPGTTTPSPPPPTPALTKYEIVGGKEVSTGSDHKINDVIDYAIHLTYAGTASDIVIHDPIPDGTTYVASSGDPATGLTATSSEVTWDLGAAGPIEQVFHLNLKVTKDNIYIHNQATVDIDGGQAVGSTGTTTQPALTVHKTATPSSVATGGTITYTITVSYTGQANDITVTDVVPVNTSLQPGGTQPVSVDTSKNPNTLTWSLKELQKITTSPSSFTDQTITYTVKVNPGINNTSIVSIPTTATVNGAVDTSGGGSNTPPNEETCNGHWTLTGAFHNGTNFGDPNCDLAKSPITTYTAASWLNNPDTISEGWTNNPPQALIDLITQLDPSNLNNWLGIATCESHYDPNAFEAVADSTSGLGGYGLFQMNPHPLGTDASSVGFDIGNVPWQEQTSNAINHEKSLVTSGLSWRYWSCAHEVLGLW